MSEPDGLSRQALTGGGPDGLPATLAEVPGVPTGGEDNTW